MSDPILALLQHEDPAQRKRGISAAAKRADRRYLKALSNIVRNDPDDAVRQLAKKAGSHIHKQTQPAASAPASQSSASVTPQRQPVPSTEPDPDDILRSALLGDTGGDTLPDPIDVEMPVLPPRADADPAQAQAHYDQAFELHLKGQDAHAALELATAFYKNPALSQDATALAFAAEMTGMPPAQAARYIADPANWRAMTDNLGGFKGKKNADQPEKRGTNTGIDTSSLEVWVFGAVGVLVVVALLIAFIGSGAFATVLQDSFNTLTGVEIPSTAAPPVLTPTTLP